MFFPRDTFQNMFATAYPEIFPVHTQGAYKLAWQRAQVPLKGEKVNCWFIKTEDPVPVQLPRYFTTPIEVMMAQWTETRKR